MTQSELDEILNEDPYHVSRKNPGDSEVRLFLREVDFHCPLCGRELQSRSQKKPKQKLFEIAHIYPNRPTIQQYNELYGLERLGQSSEDFENKIALCFSCHSTQDYHTTKEDYLRLLSIKKSKLERCALHDAVNEMHLDAELEYIVNRIRKTPLSQLSALKMVPVPLADKFEDEDAPLYSRIIGHVSQYYTYIRDLFKEQDGNEGFVFTALCLEVRAAYIRMEAASTDKEAIFCALSNWINTNVPSASQTACDIIAAFFVQNCEVFNEISK